MFTIIVPTYNRENHLLKCLSSVKEQFFADWECLVIDDGSTDGTKLLVQNFTKGDERFRYHYQSNAERCAARNSGIDLAKGEYICFLDSDDQFKEDHLLKLSEFVKTLENKKCLMFTNYRLNEKEQGCLPFVPTEIKHLTHFLLTHSIIPDRICAHRSIFQEFKFDADITVGEDSMLWARIAQKYSIIPVEQSTVLYTLHEENTIHLKNNSASKLIDGFNRYFQRYPAIKNQLSASQLSLMYSEMYFQQAKHFLYVWNRSQALKSLFTSLVFSLKHPQSKYKVKLMMQVLKGNQEFCQNEVAV